MPCIHKAVIGCALTALPGCCSCSDQRPYAEAYPIYIDGQGMKMQGKRWARYCWKCRDYWKQNDAEELQLQLQSDAANRRDAQAPTWSFPAAMPPSTPISGRLRGGMASGAGLATSTGWNQSLATRSRAQDSTVRNQIERHRREHSARTASPPLRRVSPEVVTERTEPISHERPPRPNPLVASFGTREEIEAEDYQSPITSMFGRAWDRYRTAEVGRRQLEDEMLDHYLSTSTRHQPRPDTARIRNPFEPREPVTPRPMRYTQSTTVPPVPQHGDERHPRALPAETEVLRLAQSASRVADFVARQASHTHPRRLSASPPPRVNPIDTQIRPPGLSQAEMTVSIACRICNEQRSDTLLNPCMHICMCRWCSDILKANAVAARRNRPPGAPRESTWKCPICRTNIAGVTKIYMC